jgi:lysozyme family protein
MAAANFSAALAFVWRPEYDSPDQGYHVTVGDSGGGTLGGVIGATWSDAVKQGLVMGQLKNATRAQLSTVLLGKFWGPACNALPAGLDFALFNGRMMSGGYPRLFQQALGFTGDDVDGDIGDQSIAVALNRDPKTLLACLTGVHYGYLTKLDGWAEFKDGWTHRLLAARELALQLSQAVPTSFSPGFDVAALQRLRRASP